MEELKASADKLRSELEQKANETNTTLQDQINELKQVQADKSAVENLTESLQTETPGLETIALETPKEETTENITALSPAEQAEQEEIELDDKLAYYINQYDPDNPLPANSENAHSEKTEQSSNKS